VLNIKRAAAIVVIDFCCGRSKRSTLADRDHGSPYSSGQEFSTLASPVYAEL